MTFKRALQRYGQTPEPDTPYQRAGQVWDERIGSARVQAHSWRLMAFGSLVWAGGLASALVWQSLQSRVVPYVVAVDRLGAPQAIGPAEEAYQPTDPEIAWFLSRFIEDVRGRSLDPVLTRQKWLQAYDFATRRGGLFLGAYARGADPFAGVGERTVSIEVTSVVRASPTSFEVKWTETAYERGALDNTSHWTGILTISVRPPRDADTLRKNPLGLYVDAIDWSREFEPPATPAPSAATPPSPPPSAGAAPTADLPTESAPLVP